MDWVGVIIWALLCGANNSIVKASRIQWLQWCHYGLWGWYTGKTHKIILASTSPIVRPYNNCKVRSYNNCKVRPYNECKVWPYNSCKVSHFYVLHSCKVAPYNHLMICIIAAVLCYIFMWVYFFKVKPNILKKYFL